MVTFDGSLQLDSKNGASPQLDVIDTIGTARLNGRLACLTRLKTFKSIAILSTCVAFLGQPDIILDSYHREILSDEELGLGNSVHVNAYRMASLVHKLSVSD